MRFETIVQTAVDEAVKVDGHTYKHGCVIFDKNGLIAKGRNKQRYHPKLRRYGYNRNCWLHAESDALLKCSHLDLRRATLLVLRKSSTKLSNSRPCNGCMAMIREKKLKRVLYSDTSGEIVLIALEY